MFFYTPLLQEPPDVPLPCPQENLDWYGELYLKYPLNQRLYPAQFGKLFKSRAAFYMILNELRLRLSVEEPLSDEDIAGFYSRFKDWFQNLPEPLSPRKVVLPDHLKLQ